MKKEDPASLNQSKKNKRPATKKYFMEEPAPGYETMSFNKAILMMGMQQDSRFRLIKNDTDFIDIIREGIPKEAMNNLMDITDISLQEMSGITHVSDRTLRRYHGQDKLPQEQSERVVELAKLYTRGSEVLGGLANFKEWMGSKLIPLGHKRPKEFLDTSLGIDLLMKELGRIEQGIFA